VKAKKLFYCSPFTVYFSLPERLLETPRFSCYTVKIAISVKDSGAMAGENTFQDSRYAEFRDITEQIAEAVGTPRFYIEKKEAVERSLHIFERNPVAQDLLVLLKDREDYPGHGILHITKVARDAGALVIIDGPGLAEGDALDRLIFLAHLAGILHDIRRSEPDHARRGAEAAGEILKTLDLKERESDAVIQAIANH
jgi:hypothetical protein